MFVPPRLACLIVVVLWLQVENVECIPPNHIKFDFLGKDSIRYENTVDVEVKVYKAVEQFTRTDSRGKREYSTPHTGQSTQHSDNRKGTTGWGWGRGGMTHAFLALIGAGLGGGVAHSERWGPSGSPGRQRSITGVLGGCGFCLAVSRLRVWSRMAVAASGRGTANVMPSTAAAMVCTAQLQGSTAVLLLSLYLWAHHLVACACLAPPLVPGSSTYINTHAVSLAPPVVGPLHALSTRLLPTLPSSFLLPPPPLQARVRVTCCLIPLTRPTSTRSSRASWTDSASR